MQRIRLSFALLAVLLLVPLSLLLARTLAGLDREQAQRHQVVASRVFDEAERTLTVFLNEEESRPAEQYFPTLIDVLERGGRYTCSGAIAGPIVDLDLRTLYLRDLTFTGATVVPSGTFADLVEYIERGEVKPLLAATYPLKDLATAQAEFIQKQHIGNIVVYT